MTSNNKFTRKCYTCGQHFRHSEEVELKRHIARHNIDERVIEITARAQQERQAREVVCSFCNGICRTPVAHGPLLRSLQQHRSKVRYGMD